jgi:uncharacterized protein YecT (DUF1311 family)
MLHPQGWEAGGVTFRFSTIILLFCLVAFQAAAQGPNFECAKGGTAVENAICADPALRALDSEVDKLYQVRLAEGALSKATQDRWLAGRAQACLKELGGRCLEQYLKNRADLLKEGGPCLALEQPLYDLLRTPNVQDVLPAMAAHSSRILSLQSGGEGLSFPNFVSRYAKQLHLSKEVLDHIKSEIPRSRYHLSRAGVSNLYMIEVRDNSSECRFQTLVNGTTGEMVDTVFYLYSYEKPDGLCSERKKTGRAWLGTVDGVPSLMGEQSDTEGAWIYFVFLNGPGKQNQCLATIDFDLTFSLTKSFCHIGQDCSLFENAAQALANATSATIRDYRGNWLTLEQPVSLPLPTQFLIPRDRTPEFVSMVDEERSERLHDTKFPRLPTFGQEVGFPFDQFEERSTILPMMVDGRPMMVRIGRAVLNIRSEGGSTSWRYENLTTDYFLFSFYEMVGEVKSPSASVVLHATRKSNPKILLQGHFF